jgi:DNA polymerase III sliding clamp (beta) subunit (PCNA family)
MFFDGVQQAATATSELSRGVSVSVRPRLLSLSARAADKGDSKVEIATETEGKHADVSVDGAYFAEMLRSVDSSLQITLKVVDDGGVVVSTGDGMLSLLAGMGG